MTNESKLFNQDIKVVPFNNNSMEETLQKNNRNFDNTILNPFLYQLNQEYPYPQNLYNPNTHLYNNIFELHTIFFNSVLFGDNPLFPKPNYNYSPNPEPLKPNNTILSLYFKNISEFYPCFEQKKTSTFLNKKINNENKELLGNKLKKNNSVPKGRKLKTSSDERKHNKYSQDNMMRKIKNKVIEYARQLINKIYFEEKSKSEPRKTIINKYICKILPIFTQNLGIKFNLDFYFKSIQEIFSLPKSNLYSNSKIKSKSNNKLLQEIIDDRQYEKTQILLKMKFHEFYHKIFLDENKFLRDVFKIKDEDNNYNIHHFKEELIKDKENDDLYIDNILNLSRNYEDYFLYKKPRKSKKMEKKSDIEVSNKNDNYFNELKIKIENLKEMYDKNAYGQKYS